MIECPNHGGGFDCTPFCNLCEGNQEYEGNPMNEYTLTAELDTTIAEVIITADSEDEATMNAIGVVLDNAYDNAGVWAKGAITLTDSNGNVLHTMDAK